MKVRRSDSVCPRRGVALQMVIELSLGIREGFQVGAPRFLSRAQSLGGDTPALPAAAGKRDDAVKDNQAVNAGDDEESSSSDS